MPVLKGVIQVKFYFYLHFVSYENPNKRRKIEFSKHGKTRFQENFDFRVLCVSLMKFFTSNMVRLEKKLEDSVMKIL